MNRIFQPNLTGGILSEGMYARSDTSKYNVGVKDALNMLIKPQGGMKNRAGFTLAGGMDTSSALAYQWHIPFQFSTEDTYVLEFSDGVMRVLRRGAYILTATPVALTAISYANPAILTFANDAAATTFTAGHLVYFNDPNGDHTLHQQVFRLVARTGATWTFQVYDGTPVDTSAGAGTWGAIGAGATIQRVYQTAQPYALTDLPNVRFAQDADTMFLAHRGYQPKRLRRLADDNWVIDNVPFGPEVGAPASVSVTVVRPDGGSDFGYVYQVSAIRGDTLEEGLTTQSATVINNLNVGTNNNVITWPAVSGAVLYNVYKQTSSIAMAFIGTTSSLSFTDRNITPDQSIRPQTVRNPFPSANNYPGVVAFVEQRLAFASTNNDPQVVEMSRTDNLTNFTISYPTRADDAVRFRVRARQLNRIHGLVPARALLMMTTAAEWTVTGNENEGIITPTSIVVKPETYWGAADIEPVVIGDTAMFLEQSGNTIRDYKLDVQDKSADVTIACRDLFEDRVVTSWTYAHVPDRALWVTLNDGSLLSLTYMAEHDIWGWTRHQLGGVNAKARQVVSVREGTRDVLYVTVERILNGLSVVLLERLAERIDTNVVDAYFVDSGLTYDGAPTRFVSGLFHLRGQEVTALYDGDVLESTTVDEAGVIDIGDRLGSVVHAGLAYTSHVQTLDVDFEADGLGSMQGRFKAASEVAIVLEKSRGISAGINLEDQNELDEWTPEMVNGPIPLKTQTINVLVDGDWLRNAQVVVRQRYPLPMTVNGIAPDWEPGE